MNMILTISMILTVGFDEHAPEDGSAESAEAVMDSLENRNEIYYD